MAALTPASEWNNYFLGAAHWLPTRIVKEDPLPLASFKHEQCRPLLIKAAALTIDESSERLHLRSRCWGAAGQWFSKRQTARCHLRNECEVERDPADIVDVCEWLAHISASNGRSNISGLPAVVDIGGDD